MIKTTDSQLFLAGAAYAASVLRRRNANAERRPVHPAVLAECALAS